MNRSETPDLGRHNLEQQRYFERSVKRTMVPRGTPYLRRHISELLNFAGISPGMRTLEVGCGMGRYTLLLAELGMRVEGLDLTPFLLEKLAEFNAGRFHIPLHCADIIDHPPQLDGEFDAVVGFFVLHHLHDLERCFEATVRLARPGGRVVFVEPNAFNILYYLQILLTPRMTWRGDRGVARMRPGVVLPAMERAGLVKVKMDRFGFFPPMLANNPAGARVEAFLEAISILRPILPFQIFCGERP